jgi:protein gp37
MSDQTGIEWTDHTFNPWWGCSRISPACRFCYADRDAKRYGHQVWRRHGPRRMLSEANWQRPFKWNRDAQRAGIPAKVFCASMADVFEDHPDVREPRQRLWDVIEATPWLRWQLLTKRPENVAEMVPWGDSWPPWVWLGTSVENQPFAEQRIPLLFASPAHVRFLSLEPLLGPVDLGRYLWLTGPSTAGPFYDYAGRRRGGGGIGGQTFTRIPSRDLHWAIIGGESGPRSRPTELRWIEDILMQCRESGVAPFVKQLGAVLGRQYEAGPKGGNQESWPADLRIREFPQKMAVTA